MARKRRSLLGTTGGSKGAGDDARVDPVSSDSQDGQDDPPASEYEVALDAVTVDTAPGEPPDPAAVDDLVAAAEAAPDAHVPDLVDTVAPAADLPPSGDPDSYADAETQMDDPGGPEDPFADAAFVDELNDALEPVPPEPPPVQGMLDNDPDLYGDFGDLTENPPTEEISIPQDVAQSHSAPMHVPEPPPIPGIGDRFTPAPAQRTELGSRHAENRPSYLATPTPAPQERALFPKKEEHGGLVSTADDRRSRGKDSDEDRREEEPGGVMRYVVLGGVPVVLIVGFAIVAALSGMFSGGSDPAKVEIVPDEHHGVKVRQGVTKEGPELLGDIDGVDNPDRVLTETAPAPAPEPEPVPEPVAAPAPAPAPAPVAAPAPEPKKKKKEPEPATATKIEVRANRRALVTVDGKPVGYTPIDVPTTPGAHVVEAMLSGQAESRQVREIRIDKAGDRASLQFSF